MGVHGQERWVDVEQGGGQPPGGGGSDLPGGAAGGGSGAAPAAADPAVAAVPAAAPVFLGTHEPRLDDKGRLFLPARFRDDLAAGLVITRGQENCLYVYPKAEFDRIYAYVSTAPTTRKVTRDYVRMFLSSASSETPDKQGRVTVPPKLRDYAGLTKDCVVIGAGARLEVWDAAAWDAYLAAAETAYSEQSEEVLPGLF